jgi:hypothetical protein
MSIKICFHTFNIWFDHTEYCGSLYRSVGMVIRLQSGQQMNWGSIPDTSKWFFSSLEYPGWLHSPASLSSSWYWGKRGEGVESDCLFSLSNEVKNTWSYTSIPPYIFIGWFLIKYRYNFTFIFTVYGNIDLIFSWIFVLFHVGIYFCIYVTFAFEVVVADTFAITSFHCVQYMCTAMPAALNKYVSYSCVSSISFPINPLSIEFKSLVCDVSPVFPSI